MLTNAPVFANLAVENLERAKTFYQEKLGLQLLPEAMPGTASFQCGNGTRLEMYEREASKAEHTVATFEVSNLESAVAELKSKGVIFEEYDFPDFKTVKSIATMGLSKAAWFKDTEGNILCIHQLM